MAAMEAERVSTERLIARVRTCPDATLYRKRWGRAEAFDALPYISRADIVCAPLSTRRYKNERSLVKIVHTPEGSFLSEWSFDDIARESWGLPSKRPMVYLADPHESVEKSMWCYERGAVPLIGEKDADIAMFTASRYEIDSLITDAASLPKLAPYLQTRDPLASITILGESFNVSTLLSFRDYALDVRLVLSLPEVGAIAQAFLTERPVFTVVPDCRLEQEETLIVTKTSFLVTPIIKYRTQLRVGGFSSSDQHPSHFTSVC